MHEMKGFEGPGPKAALPGEGGSVAPLEQSQLVPAWTKRSHWVSLQEHHNGTQAEHTCSLRDIRRDIFVKGVFFLNINLILG